MNDTIYPLLWVTEVRRHHSCFPIKCLAQVRLRQKYYAPQVRPDWGSNSWPPDHDSAFHVTETPALTTSPWVTPALVWLDRAEEQDIDYSKFLIVSYWSFRDMCLRYWSVSLSLWILPMLNTSKNGLHADVIPRRSVVWPLHHFCNHFKLLSLYLDVCSQTHDRSTSGTLTLVRSSHST